MCLVKTPKLKQGTATSDKPVPILRNPFLDGLDPILRARQTGLRSLRVERRAPGAAPSPAATANPAAPPAFQLPTGGFSALTIPR